MADYSSVKEMMNTTENMEQLVADTGHDDDVLTFDGVYWFLFNGERTSKIYVSGNSFIGLGKNEEHLLVCRRDAKMRNFYREEATLFGSIKVLKLRWEGYAQYNSEAEEVILKYEWFFFETGDMFLNLICPPKNNGYLGSSRINGSAAIDFRVEAGYQQYVSFRHVDETGMELEVTYDIVDILPPFEKKYLLSDGNGVYYRLVHDKAFVDSILLKGGQFIKTGILPDQDTRIEAAFRTSVFNGAALFGAAEEGEGGVAAVYLTSSKEVSGKFGMESRVAEADDYSGIPVTLELSKEGIKRDGILIAEFGEQVFALPAELAVGTVNINGRADEHFFEGAVTSVRIWQGEEQVLDLIPCVDENTHPCFYDRLTGGCYYNEGYGIFGFEDESGAYEEATRLETVEMEQPDSEAFHAHGFSDFPRSEVLMRIENPVLLCWQDSQSELPMLKAGLKAMPPPQTVYSKNNVMTDSTVFGIEKVEIEADDTALFAFSFDGGGTWKAYLNGRWGELSEETSGMSREAVEEIGTDAWADAVTENQYMVRFTVFEGGYVNRIIIHYVN